MSNLTAKSIASALGLALLVTFFSGTGNAAVTYYSSCQSDIDHDNVGYGSVSCKSSPSYVSICTQDEKTINHTYLGCYGSYDNDNCPYAANASQTDANRNGIGDVCEGDQDIDGITDANDNCPTIKNSDQINSDNDSNGNACDTDDDNDGVLDGNDNCPINNNPDQLNTDGDWMGNACDSTPNDPDGGTRDTSFTGPSLSYNGEVRAIALQPDQKLVIGGLFTSVNGLSTYNRLARLNSNGSLDTSFNPGGNIDNFITALAIQPDGKIIIAGRFTTFSNTSRNRIARLNPDGSLDTSFNPGTGANDAIEAMLRQPDGQILIAGSFTSFNGITRNRIARLNPNGQLDTTFNPGSGADNNWVSALALQADGKILIGGSFSTVNGTPRTSVARLLWDGTLDSTFIPGLNSWVKTLTVQPDGKVLAGGQFTRANNLTRNLIARLNTDGSVDTGFDARIGTGSEINTISIQADNKIVIAGQFGTIQGVSRINIARVWPDGTLDQGFSPGTGVNGRPYYLAMQADGKLLFGGGITSYNSSGISYLTRIHTGNTDSDTVQDALDNCTAIANPDQTNTDHDLLGDACDPDDDNDNVSDLQDQFPLDNQEWVDTDGDGSGNNSDSDDDNDNVSDLQDQFPLDNQEWIDTDGDGSGNNSDPDDDNDGTPDVMDPLPLASKFHINSNYHGTNLHDSTQVP